MRWQTLYEARWIFAVALAVTGTFYVFIPMLTIVGALFILYVFYFFRDPPRFSKADDDSVLAAADGVVAEIRETFEPEVMKKPVMRVAIFLSVFNVHVNRAPIAGKVVYSKRTPGKFLDARDPEATNLNEYWTWGFEGAKETITVRQITGAIARRIVGWSKVGDVVKRGHRFGMIRFGSRTEIYLPHESAISVKVGDRVKGGVTVIARLSSGKP